MSNFRRRRTAPGLLAVEVDARALDGLLDDLDRDGRALADFHEHVFAVVDLDLVGVLVERLLEGVPDVARPDVIGTPILWSLVVGLCVAEWVYRKAPILSGVISEGGRLPAIAGRYALVAAMLVASGASNLDVARPFIYFQF